MYWMAALAQLMPNAKNSIKKKNLFSLISLKSIKNRDKALKCIRYDHPCWLSGQGEKSVSPRDRAPCCTDVRGSFWLHSPELSRRLCRQPRGKGGTWGLQPLRKPEIPPGGMAIAGSCLTQA